MRVIGFTGAAHTYPGHADALTDAGAETVIRRWAELKPVLAALASGRRRERRQRSSALQARPPFSSSRPRS